MARFSTIESDARSVSFQANLEEVKKLARAVEQLAKECKDLETRLSYAEAAVNQLQAR